MRDEVTFPSGSDLCAAWLYHSKDTGGPAPCVVMAHGFAGTRDDGLPAFAERFAAAGLHALVFDYRSFGASGGEPRQVIDIGRQQDDYRAAIAFARSLDGVDGIVLWGTSFSGGHVLDLAAGESGILAAIAQAPFADGIAALRANSPRNMAIGAVAGVADTALGLLGLPPLRLPVVGAPGSLAAMTEPSAEPGMRAIVPRGSRWENAVAARVMLHVGTWRPVSGAARIEPPLLVCVADRDATTPPAPAIRAAERAPRGELARFSCGHFDIYRGEPFERVVAVQLAFLARHAGAAGDVSPVAVREAS